MLLTYKYGSPLHYNYITFIYKLRYIKQMWKYHKFRYIRNDKIFEWLRDRLKNINDPLCPYSLPFYIKHANPTKKKLKSLEENFDILTTRILSTKHRIELCNR